MMENGSPAVIRSPEDTVKCFQAYLRKYENDDKLVILEAVDRPGTKLGDNYTSELIRTKLVGTRGDGSPYAKTFMTKMNVRDSKISTLINLSDLFRMEALAYTKILPILGPFGPSCVYTDKDTIIMEDLAVKGYTTCERRNFLDLDHTVFTLKKLAKLHALALTVKINNPRQFGSLKMEEIIYKDNSEGSIMRSSTEICVQSLVEYLDVIEGKYEQEVQGVRDHLANYVDKAYDAMHRLFTAPKQKYDTLCHGDPWINNLLFLHDKNGRIIDLKMIDYQIIRHTSSTTDVLYFLYSSVRSSLIESSFESLIKIYHNEFISELRRSHIDEKILAELGMEWLETELRTYAFYGLIVGCFFVNPIMAEEEDVKEFERVEFGTQNPLYRGDMNSPINQKKLARVRCILFHYYRRLHLGIINDDIEPISITG